MEVTETRLDDIMYAEKWPCVPKKRRLSRAQNAHYQMSRPGVPRIVYVDDAEDEDVIIANDVFELDEMIRAHHVEGAVLEQFLGNAPAPAADPDDPRLDEKMSARVEYLIELNFSGVRQEIGMDEGIPKRIPISLAILTSDESDTSSRQTSNVGYAAGSLSRSPDWMGVWMPFSSLHGLPMQPEAIVFYNGDRIWSVFITNRVSLAGVSGSMPPTKESHAMRRILSHHGVGRVAALQKEAGT